jgi:hypothetical protein
VLPAMPRTYRATARLPKVRCSTRSASPTDADAPRGGSATGRRVGSAARACFPSSSVHSLRSLTTHDPPTSTDVRQPGRPASSHRGRRSRGLPGECDPASAVHAPASTNPHPCQMSAKDTSACEAPQHNDDPAGKRLMVRVDAERLARCRRPGHRAGNQSKSEPTSPRAPRVSPAAGTPSHRGGHSLGDETGAAGSTQRAGVATTRQTPAVATPATARARALGAEARRDLGVSAEKDETR